MVGEKECEGREEVDIGIGKSVNNKFALVSTFTHSHGLIQKGLSISRSLRFQKIIHATKSFNSEINLVSHDQIIR